MGFPPVDLKESLELLSSGGTLTGPLTLAGDALTDLQPVTLEQLNAMFATLQIAYGIDPRSVGSGSAAAWPLANRIIYVRNIGATINMSKMGIYISVGSGNLQTAVYANNGLTGAAAAPTGSPLGLSGTVSIAAASTRTFINLGATVTCHFGDWMAVQIDNVTAQVVRIATAARMGDGLVWQEDPGSFGLSNPVGTLATCNYCPSITGNP